MEYVLTIRHFGWLAGCKCRCVFDLVRRLRPGQKEGSETIRVLQPICIKHQPERRKFHFQSPVHSRRLCPRRTFIHCVRFKVSDIQLALLFNLMKFIGLTFVVWIITVLFPVTRSQAPDLDASTTTTDRPLTSVLRRRWFKPLVGGIQPKTTVLLLHSVSLFLRSYIFVE